MLRTRQLIQLLERGVSQRKISLQLRMSRNIVSSYAVRIRESGNSYQELLDLDDASLSFLLSMSSVHEAVPDERFSSLEPLLPGYIKELKKTGVTKLLLWEEYGITPTRSRNFLPDSSLNTLYFALISITCLFQPKSIQ